MTTTSPHRSTVTPLILNFHSQPPELVWAWPLGHAHHQRFRFHTVSPGAELVPGDIVAALPDHRGDLHITKVTALIGHFTIVFRLLQTAELGEVQDLLEDHEDYDYRFHELPDGRHLFIWDDFYHLTLEETLSRLSIPTVATGSGHLAVTSQSQRHRLLQRRADFRSPAAPVYPRVLHDTIVALRQHMGRDDLLAGRSHPEIAGRVAVTTA